VKSEVQSYKIPGSNPLVAHSCSYEPQHAPGGFLRRNYVFCHRAAEWALKIKGNRNLKGKIAAALTALGIRT
jgi:hypothetical protein